MYFTKTEYKNVIDNFLIKHHGQITKLLDKDKNIFGYVLRCESSEDDKSTLVFSIVPDIIYVGKKRVNPKEVKYYGVKRSLEKWKAVKKELYKDFSECESDEFKNIMKSDVECLYNMYKDIRPEIQFNIDEVSEYIFKILMNIKSYYKETSKIRMIFL